MRFLTTIPGLTVPHIRAEIVACLVDLPNCEPYNTSDWYTVRLQGDDETDVPGDDLGPIVVIDDE